MAVAAIPTEYAGVRFRSRLEARWASFFDLCGWRWDYEPLDLDGYIPDFMLWLKQPVLVEVKPLIWSNDETEKQIIKAAETKIRFSGVRQEAILLGARLPGDHGWHQFIGKLNYGDCPGQYDANDQWWVFGDNAFGFRCTHCGMCSFGADEQSYHCRASGCYDGTGHIGDWDVWADFRRAGNAAQWKGL